MLSNVNAHIYSKKEYYNLTRTCKSCYDDHIKPCDFCPNHLNKSHEPICATCMKSQVEIAIGDMYNGICRPLFCTTCQDTNKPILTYKKWKKLVNHDRYDRYEKLALHLVTFRCGQCHNETCVDPIYVVSNTFCKTTNQIIGQYTCGKLSISHTYDQLVRQCTENNFDIVQIIASIANPERRVNLFLKHMNSFPYVYTKCCKALHCFKCKVMIHGSKDHICSNLENVSEMNDLSQCPNCNIILVKSEGCNAVRCVCGTSFSWNEQLAKFKNNFLSQYPTDTSMHCALVLINQPNVSPNSSQIMWYNSHKDDVNFYLMQSYLNIYKKYPIHAYLSSNITNVWLKTGGKVYFDRALLQNPDEIKKIQASIDLARLEIELFKQKINQENDFDLDTVVTRAKSFLFLCGNMTPVISSHIFKFGRDYIVHQNDVTTYLYEEGLQMLVKLYFDLYDGISKRATDFSNFPKTWKKFIASYSKKFITMFKNVPQHRHEIELANKKIFKLYRYVDDNKIFFKLGTITFSSGYSIQSFFSNNLLVIKDQYMTRMIYLKSYLELNSVVLFRPSETIKASNCTQLTVHRNTLIGEIVNIMYISGKKIMFVDDCVNSYKVIINRLSRYELDPYVFIPYTSTHPHISAHHNVKQSVCPIKKMNEVINYIEQLEKQNDKISLKLFANFCAVLPTINKLDTKFGTVRMYGSLRPYADLSEIVTSNMKITWNLVMSAISWYIQNKFVIDIIIYKIIHKIFNF